MRRHLRKVRSRPPPAKLLKFVRTQSIDGDIVRRGLKTRTAAAQLARQRLESLPPALLAAAPITGTSVAGSVEVPIITILFSNTTTPPYPISNFQRELFDGPWPTGTMSEHYREMSRGKFSVAGQVFDWVPLPQDDVFYSGPAGCHGIFCATARLGDLLSTALTQVDNSIDFRRFDNDGPDNVPNSATMTDLPTLSRSFIPS